MPEKTEFFGYSPSCKNNLWLCLEKKPVRVHSTTATGSAVSREQMRVGHVLCMPRKWKIAANHPHTLWTASPQRLALGTDAWGVVCITPRTICAVAWLVCSRSTQKCAVQKYFQHKTRQFCFKLIFYLPRLRLYGVLFLTLSIFFLFFFQGFFYSFKSIFAREALREIPFPRIHRQSPQFTYELFAWQVEFLD